VRVAIAQDWMTAYLGSERVVEALAETFPGALVLTSVIARDELPPVLAAAEPSFLQRIPGSVRYHEWLLPLMPLAWRLRPLPPDLDLVISSSHACAKAVRAPEGTPHLCYCHTPMRYAWDFEAEQERFPRAIRPAARVGMGVFRAWDRRVSERVSRFVANSSAVAERIQSYYGREAEVVHPPVETDYFTPGGERGDDFLYVGRLVSYKRADLAVAAFADLPYRLLVVGKGQLGERLRATATSNVTFLGELDRARLRELLRSARALVYPADEDFGIAMAEAQACGTPVIGLARGGALDIVEPGVTGWLADRADTEELRRAVRLAASEELDHAEIRRRAERFSTERFRREMRAQAEEVVAGYGTSRQ
jgi:glycosyltransferase involved in cell wall biosynthesis